MSRGAESLTENLPPDHHEANQVAVAGRKASPRLAWDFSKISLFPPDRKDRSKTSTQRLYPKLAIGHVNDPLEQEVDRANTEDRKGDSTTAGIPRVDHDLSRISVFAQSKDASSTTQNQLKTWGSAGGLSGLTLDVTFSVSDTPAASLQAIQTFMGTRRTDGVRVGTYSWMLNGKTWDAFVDGGINSPYVTMGGNSPAHPTQPYYLTPAEVSSQVAFSKDAGTIRVFDAPGAVAMHEEARFETAIVAVNFKGTNKDKVLKAFKWGWTGKGTKPTISKGTEIAGTPSGISVSNTVSAGFVNIVKHDYPKYDI
jgi:hypothetical protein